jgi:uncharacterized peroxidase-related enzyme
VGGAAAFISEGPASPEGDEIFEQYAASDGYVANYARVWCWRPEILTAFAALRAQLTADSSLTPREIAVLTVGTASERGDSYCSLAWGGRLAALADNETAAAAVRGEDIELSPREDALLAWARAVVADPNVVSGKDIERLRSAGLDDREIFEATVWIGFRLGFSTINDALGVRPDRELAESVPPSVREAVAFGRVPA